jgi:hypothetical protein
VYAAISILPGFMEADKSYLGRLWILYIPTMAGWRRVRRGKWLRGVKSDGYPDCAGSLGWIFQRLFRMDPSVRRAWSSLAIRPVFFAVSG